MIIKSANDIAENQILDFPYKSKKYKVGNTTIKWLTQCCDPEMPSYGLRLFTIGPGGYIPIHNHQYVQTMYILTGKISVTSYNDIDEVLEEKILGPNDFVYVPSMQPHSMKNVGDEPVKFLCCIAVLDEEELALSRE
jgi:quercetin dioxygenase-like cupin family protein